MSQTLALIILGELCLVLLTGSAVLLISNRNRKKRWQTGLEELLDDINDRQEKRGDRLTQAIISKHRLGLDLAQNISERLIAAEKFFLLAFVEQQMQQQGLGGFYENLCRLLDSYLDNLAKSGESETPTPNQSATEPAEPDIAAPAEPRPEEATPSENPPPDWGDVFD